MANRIILHLDMDYFFAQVEERENPHFKGRPVIVGATPKNGKGRGVVSTANYEARKYGIKSAMPISQAWYLCPHAVFLPANIRLYSEVSERIMQIVRKYSSFVEQVSLDEAYLDLSHLASFQKAKVLAENLKKEIFQKEQLTSTCGIGPNKMIAKIACRKAKPNGLLVIHPREIEQFLEPLDIEEIPGIGPKTAEFLKKVLGKTSLRVHDLKRLKKEELINLFGVVGERIYERVRGIDTTSIITQEQVKSIGKEHTFESDTRDSKLIFSVFKTLLREVYRELKTGKFLFRTITVICRFQGFETHTKSKTLPKPLQDKTLLFKEATRLLLQFLLESSKPVRLVGVRLKIGS